MTFSLHDAINFTDVRIEYFTIVLLFVTDKGHDMPSIVESASSN